MTPDSTRQARVGTRPEAVASGLDDRLEGATVATPSTLPLVVDLDGTLLRSDLLYESVVRLLHLNPFYVLLLPVWLMRGRAHLKREVARRVTIDVRVLPYRQELLVYLAEQRDAGRPLLLATTSDALLAERVASHLGLFDTVLASDGIINLKGRAKAAEVARALNDGPFAYAGNEWADVPVWDAARARVVVSGDRRLIDHVRRLGSIERVFEGAGWSPVRLIDALRLNHWVKNLLVFVPLAAAHRLDEPGLVLQAVGAFVAFGLVASGGYVMNDVADVEADRRHARKRLRPIASGDLDVRVGLATVAVLVLSGLGLGLVVAPGVALTLLGYLAASVGYTFLLKRVVLADVFTLAILYASRLVAGSLAVAVAISHWLLAFSVFFFLCLAFVKRYSELYDLRANNIDQAEGRGYVVSDFTMLSSLGAASGYISVLVLALYINAPEVTELYRTPEVLWLVGLVLLYWISRIWIVAHRGLMHDDPIVFALRDPISYAAGGICLLAFVVASL